MLLAYGAHTIYSTKTKNVCNGYLGDARILFAHSFKVKRNGVWQYTCTGGQNKNKKGTAEDTFEMDASYSIITIELQVRSFDRLSIFQRPFRRYLLFGRC